MIIEGYLLLWGLIIFLIVLAEWGSLKKYSMGVLAGLLIILSGLYFLVDGVQFREGEVRQINYSLSQNITFNITNNYTELHEQIDNSTERSTGNSTGTQIGTSEGTQIGTERITYIYADLNPQPAFFNFADLLGLVQVLVGLYMITHYSLRLTS